ncbi:unnamed protein product [Arabidopsis arenosa]|uniref:C3H1-type domain-containing protein n=1 Tax=Arabidopsis arenosa TaxID=38785 RepID=A0A8S2AAI6_ARAAE|nr:unnamed protein product [Arabidopsis arenosa]
MWTEEDDQTLLRYGWAFPCFMETVSMAMNRRHTAQECKERYMHLAGIVQPPLPIVPPAIPQHKPKKEGKPTCKFYHYGLGICKKGDKCEFRHYETLPRNRTAPPPPVSKFEEMVKSSLRGDEDLFLAFKEVCCRYQHGVIDITTFLNYLQDLGLSHILIDLARVFTNPQKQTEIIEAYKNQIAKQVSKPEVIEKNQDKKHKSCKPVIEPAVYLSRDDNAKQEMIGMDYLKQDWKHKSCKPVIEPAVYLSRDDNAKQEMIGMDYLKQDWKHKSCKPVIEPAVYLSRDDNAKQEMIGMDYLKQDWKHKSCKPVIEPAVYLSRDDNAKQEMIGMDYLKQDWKHKSCKPVIKEDGSSSRGDKAKQQEVTRKDNMKQEKKHESYKPVIETPVYLSRGDKAKQQEVTRKDNRKQEKKHKSFQPVIKEDGSSSKGDHAKQVD